ncbi:OmpA family protein [Pantoea sp. Cy-639]|uniref:OmpA family protein n=1 Tax=Pantoea sp. Cy-639 TaxID=2608360 RepID=UPI001423135D|nr:OmpA family protein [Pantoea sp. Cy-639]NIF15796.1 OmpA family protein [Pantoea sp. Cy-639]
MSKNHLLPALSVLALMLAGCAATPENPQLVDAREAFTALQGKPESHRLAALETQQAQAALQRAEAASQVNRKSPEVEELAYEAKSKTDTANAVIDRRLAEAKLKGVEAERAKAQLDVRTAQLNALKALKADKVEQTERGTVVTFGDVLFKTGSAELSDRSHDDIQRLARFLSENPERKVRIEGFTDSTGGNELNQRLSENRAESVSRALQRQGVDRARIATRGYGKAYPVASNGAHSRHLNRRVEVIISQGSEVVRAR